MSEMSEQNVYGASSSAGASEPATPRTKIRTHHLQKMKAEGHKWAMLTAYDYSTASVFDGAGIPVLLVGDSAANVVYGYDTTVPVSIDELIPLVRGVVRGARHALVVADLPFGSYEAGPAAALAAATRFMKEGGAHAVKLEGGERVTEQIACLTAAGIPVMAHIGFTPQSVNSLGGFRVQGRGDAAEQTVADAIAVAEAGAFSVVMEMVPAELATQITGKLTIPTIGIGAGPELRRPGPGLAGHGRDERAASPPASSSGSPTSGVNCAGRQCNTHKRWPAGFSRPTSTASDPTPTPNFQLVNGW